MHTQQNTQESELQKDPDKNMIKNMIVKVIKKTSVKYFFLHVKCVSLFYASEKDNKVSDYLCFCGYAVFSVAWSRRCSVKSYSTNYFMKIGCFRSLKESSKQSVFSKVTGLQGSKPVDLVKGAPFHWCFPRNLIKWWKLVILYQHASCECFCKSLCAFTEKERLN